MTNNPITASSKTTCFTSNIDTSNMADKENLLRDHLSKTGHMTATTETTCDEIADMNGSEISETEMKLGNTNGKSNEVKTEKSIDKQDMADGMVDDKGFNEKFMPYRITEMTK